MKCQPGLNNLISFSRTLLLGIPSLASDTMGVMVRVTALRRARGKIRNEEVFHRQAVGKRYPHCEPSPKSCGKLREAIREETARSTQWKEPEEVFARVNMRVRGWIGYFHYANSSRLFDKMRWQVRARMRRWLWKKHAKTKAQYGRHDCDERLHGQYGLIRFALKTKWRHS